MFLNNEHIIIMDHDANRLLPGELAMLAEAGIKTIYAHALVKWPELQPNQESSVIWDAMDSYVENIQRAGLKVLIPFLHSFPDWWPDEWYFARKQTGIPNYANARVSEVLDDLAGAIIARYPPEIAQVIYGMPADGEFPCEFWPNSNTLPFPTRVLSDWAIARHKVLEAQHGEVWSAFHCYTQPVWFDDFYGALHSAYPNSQHYAIAFTHFIHNRQCQIDTLAHNRDAYGMRYFAGSEYVQGFARHLPMCIREGVWGFITAPVHTFQSFSRMQPWMVDEIRRANETLQRSHAPIPVY